MYTLSRAFLQETYITADYNTRTSNVSQAICGQNANSQIVAIPSDMPVPVSGRDRMVLALAIEGEVVRVRELQVISLAVQMLV